MHISVLKEEVAEYLGLSEGEVVVDATLGLGGHALDILQKVGKSGRLVAFEQDERNLLVAQERLDDYRDQITYIHRNFCYLKTGLIDNGFEKVDAILFDLGLSSPHVDQSERGFSFMQNGPLDMRFDPRSKKTAADVINAYSENDLLRIFREYGEEKLSGRIVRSICERRKLRAFETTVELAEFIKEVYPAKLRSRSSHPATKVFQALRMEVNSELEVLEEVLPQAFEVLRPGGRIVLISYHSLEDRIVKKYFKALEQPKAEGEEAIFKTFADPYVTSLTKKPVVPSESEISINPRSRSAKLRAYLKIREN